MSNDEILKKLMTEKEMIALMDRVNSQTSERVVRAMTELNAQMRLNRKEHDIVAGILAALVVDIVVITSRAIADVK